MKQKALSVIIFGVFILIGGMIGFVKAHSIPSLVAGSVFAAALILAGIAMLRQMRIGLFAAHALVLTLLLFFSYRYVLTEKFFPAALMVLFSLVVEVVLLKRNHQTA